MISRWARVRIGVCAAVFLLLALAVGKKAYKLQVLDHENLRGRAEAQHLREVEIAPPQRGRILDRNGQELATTAQVDSIACNPRLLRGNVDGIRKLARAVGRDPREFQAMLDERKGYFALVKRLATPEQVERALALGLPGVRVEKQIRRIYPGGELGSAVIGLSNIDGEGIEGVELAWDQHLRGSRAKAQAIKDNKGRILLDELGLTDRTKTAGKDLVLTLDQHLMHVTERALRGAMAKWNAKGATAVVMDPRTGDILAMSSLPGFNPEKPAEGLALGNARIRAITDIYEPGSTLKTITMAAALEAKVVRLTESFDCQMGRPYFVGKKGVRDSHPEGILTAAEVYQKSSNIGTVKIAQRLGKQRLHDMLVRFGFGQRVGLGLRGEVRGLLAPPSRWGEIHLATISYGHGISVTPLQITAAYAAIASGGLYRPPRLVSKVVHPDGREEVLPLPSGAQPERRVLDEKVARALLEIMKGVVGKDGTAKQAAVGGYLVGGKTGTAIKPIIGGRGYGGSYIGSFVGIVPLNDPRLVISVIIDEPEPEHRGGMVAAPVFREIAEAALKYLAIPPTEPIVAKGPDGKPLLDKEAKTGGGAQRPGGLGIDEPVWEDGLHEDEVLVLGEEGKSDPEEEAAGEEADEDTIQEDLVALPSFVGLSMGQAVRLARKVGVEIAPEGSGVAVAQNPSPGSVPRGAICRVTFRPGT